MKQGCQMQVWAFIKSKINTVSKGQWITISYMMFHYKSVSLFLFYCKPEMQAQYSILWCNFRCFIFVLLIQIHTQVMKLLCFLKKTLKTKQTKDVDLFKLFSLLRQFYYVAFFNGQLKTSMTVFYGIRCNKKVQKWQIIKKVSIII